MDPSDFIAIVAVVVAIASAVFTYKIYFQGKKDAFQSISEVILHEKNSFLEAYRILFTDESIKRKDRDYLLAEHASNYCNAFEIACQLYLKDAIDADMFEETFKEEIESIYKGENVAEPIKKELYHNTSIKKVAEQWGIAYKFFGWKTASIKDSLGRTPKDYYDILSDIWSAETCAPKMRENWSADNKTFGQSSITAFLMQDIYKGKVYGIKRPDGNYHCFNVADGCVFDLTSEQFGDEQLDYTNRLEQLRDDYFAKEEIKQRYESLCKKLEEYNKSHEYFY